MVRQRTPEFLGFKLKPQRALLPPAEAVAAGVSSSRLHFTTEARRWQVAALSFLWRCLMESEAKPETAVQQRMVTLRPIAMITPTREGIYAPSRLRQGKTISYIEFLTKFADRPRPIRVSFAPDCVSNPQIVTAYGCGRDCWYIVDGNENLS